LDVVASEKSVDLARSQGLIHGGRLNVVHRLLLNGLSLLLLLWLLLMVLLLLLLSCSLLLGEELCGNFGTAGLLVFADTHFGRFEASDGCKGDFVVEVVASLALVSAADARTVGYVELRRCHLPFGEVFGYNCVLYCPEVGSKISAEE
jgi:hypothetical protein